MERGDQCELEESGEHEGSRGRGRGTGRAGGGRWLDERWLEFKE